MSAGGPERHRRTRRTACACLAGFLPVLAAGIPVATARADEPPGRFTLRVFPIGLPGVDAYDAEMTSVLDHAGAFYTQCCDDTIVAFTGERVVRDDRALLCPTAPVLPACFLTPSCICSYRDPQDEPFHVNGNYVGAFGAHYLLYDGHAGYDYGYDFGTPLLATRAGELCKAIGDPINGTNGESSAWAGFHTFYIDHGWFAGEPGEPGERGYSSWYLHASGLAGTDTLGRSLRELAVGDCAPVAEGQLVATVGNTGTLAPHLHFEVRVHDAGGSAASDGRVIDPYGFSGETPDPWATPGANPQAEPRTQPVWVPEPESAGRRATALATLGLLARRRRRIGSRAAAGPQPPEAARLA